MEEVKYIPKIHPFAKHFYSNLDFLEYKLSKRSEQMVKHSMMGSTFSPNSPKRKSRMCFHSQIDCNSEL